MIPTTPRSLQPTGWQQLWREAITDPDELLDVLGLPALRGRLAQMGRAVFPLRVPRGYVARMRPGDATDPLLRQVLPLDDEDRVAPGFSFDAVGDLAARDAPGVLHKYQGRALLITTGSCAIHCRYCFRRHFPYAEELAARGGWRESVAAIAADPSIHEVLLSGGDPLALATSKLRELTLQLAAIPHLRRLRIHTRLPLVLPERIDRELLDWLGGLPWPVAFVIHANHAREIDATVRSALSALRDSGVALLNQSVLLRGVNDSLPALAALSETLFAAGVLPYYLHLLDRVHGSAHFEVDDAVVRDLATGLRAQLPGYLVPKLVREIPGRSSKTAFD
ncbi:MAG: EF-P beta-lysylation protein EpmB [Xanthomonadales bacterium]|nr:EF-P beta-lysylation protein EpmB [Xanthomonadales bacterium]MBK7146258.1 EF-P beta-lysylation protein EpmB [Xanthomonadales bacterium]MCC6562583.1 EF-P beta-lysylation protein EpmB [Xanthomonadales bacterium]